MNVSGGFPRMPAYQAHPVSFGQIDEADFKPGKIFVVPAQAGYLEKATPEDQVFQLEQVLTKADAFEALPVSARINLPLDDSLLFTATPIFPFDPSSDDIVPIQTIAIAERDKKEFFEGILPIEEASDTLLPHVALASMLRRRAADQHMPDKPVTGKIPIIGEATHHRETANRIKIKLDEIIIQVLSLWKLPQAQEMIPSYQKDLLNRQSQLASLNDTKPDANTSPDSLKEQRRLQRLG